MTKLKYKTPVSIITVSQLNRHDCLLNLYELIQLQTYKNIIEWVIVEGSHSEEDGEKNKENINKLLQIHFENIESTIKNMKIVYVEYTGLALSDLRNLGNNKCSGDIIVCMDDDDYYPPERIHHAVETLRKSSYLIAGCSGLYMYEYFMGKLYKFNRFHKNHSTNNCMAFKREYLLNHKHTEGLTMAEESSFTNNFTEPMMQLNPLKCIIASSHSINTYNKRELCVMGSIGIHPYLNEANGCSITDYIPSERFTKMKNIFYKEEESPYDIVYFCGGFGKKWNPTDDALDDPEKDLVWLCEIAATTGRKIAVYANIFENITYNNVDYKKWNLFEFNHQYKTVILWRSYGLICGLPYALKSKFTLFNITFL
jgi:glycosyltransferase involved in cell wall biosynthesis